MMESTLLAFAENRREELIKLLKDKVCDKDLMAAINILDIYDRLAFKLFSANASAVAMETLLKENHEEIYQELSRPKIFGPAYEDALVKYYDYSGYHKEEDDEE